MAIHSPSQYTKVLDLVQGEWQHILSKAPTATGASQPTDGYWHGLFIDCYGRYQCKNGSITDGEVYLVSSSTINLKRSSGNSNDHHFVVSEDGLWMSGTCLQTKLEYTFCRRPEDAAKRLLRHAPLVRDFIKNLQGAWKCQQVLNKQGKEEKPAGYWDDLTLFSDGRYTCKGSSSHGQVNDGLLRTISPMQRIVNLKRLKGNAKDHLATISPDGRRMEVFKPESGYQYVFEKEEGSGVEERLNPLLQACGLKLAWYQHRGCIGAEKAKQNTIEGALEALAAFIPDDLFHGIEFDTMWDGGAKRWIVCHDWPEDPAVRANMPSLNSYLAAVGPILRTHGKGVQLEIKRCSGDWSVLKKLLWAHGLTDEHVMISSFSIDALRGVAAARLEETRVHYPLRFFATGIGQIDDRITKMGPIAKSGVPCSLWLRVATLGANGAEAKEWADFEDVNLKAARHGLCPCVYSSIRKAHAEILNTVHTAQVQLAEATDGYSRSEASTMHGQGKGVADGFVVMCCDDPYKEWYLD